MVRHGLISHDHRCLLYNQDIHFSLFCLYFRANVNIVRKNIDVLVKEGLGPRAEEDFQLARETISVMIKLSGGQKVIMTRDDGSFAISP